MNTKNKKKKQLHLKWKKLTPKILRSYGGKFASMSDKKAKKYIQKIEKLCQLVCQQYLRITNRSYEKRQ